MSNVDKLRRAYQAWHDTRGKSAAEWLDLLADDVAIKSLADGAPEMKFSAPRRGRAAVAAYFAELAEDWEMQFFQIDEYVAEGDRVVAIGRCGWRYKKTGKVAESPIVGLWRFRDGKVVEFLEFYDTAKAFAAAQPG